MDIELNYWDQLLRLRELCKENIESQFIALSLDTIEFVFPHDNLDVLSALLNERKVDVLLSKASFEIDGRFSSVMLTDKLHAYFPEHIDIRSKNALTLYAPLAVAQWLQQDLPFILVHMAQSLDGKVCTKSGSSKWIGNQENLIHAHRIRALVDGVLVGAKTARSEKPSLNVRHVKGPNPARIILCNSPTHLDELPNIENMKNYLICNALHKNKMHRERLAFKHVKQICYHEIASNTGMSDCLVQLKREGIHSILVEGGPTTVKTFMQTNTINWLQLHIAPMVFGSGQAFVDLPEISSVNQACEMRNVYYSQMGDAIMVTGEL
ncbi:RibD family protein [Glaciecola sp. KUL10]|uniref:RibD family protein n=1 Tax=Glaciecola sp. (strain KUL10) TaxID=2161813 RepID=UPI00131414AA|nr:RibD family protein [Glaciecola sp. KUL10]